MVRLAAGVFRMGSPPDEKGRSDDEGPQHQVRIGAFACMRTPVTRHLYQQVIGKDPGWPEGAADERPVNRVSWYDAIAFCNRLSERNGLTPCYETGEAQKGGESERRVRWNQAADGYRLLTEAEWEYACRAGSTTRYSFGDDESDLSRHAWYSQNAGNEPQPVGQKEPNAWGLHDLHGNLWEWCWDWRGPYPDAAQENPSGSESGAFRVLRGGAFVNRAEYLRSADRFWDWPEFAIQFVGFRCARGPRRQP